MEADGGFRRDGRWQKSSLNVSLVKTKDCFFFISPPPTIEMRTNQEQLPGDAAARSYLDSAW